ncbi:acyclic terpene utilization AtuA family protein [Paracoccus alkenifer]|uniref:Terpene utilization protein AtuA n=1 Tax=Paracoccus alkenifer TaxID=65735 RepID=A0A1H6MLQ1_9RHOB|nr:acyclic terpene utilization AtuA family protein [Paracoccus alkenifer]SEI02706.1 Protein of unknown function [Paracoccus alkenifer]
MDHAIRIGCGGAFWGDSPEGAAQIVRQGNVDYLVMDYLAEVTMAILSRMKSRAPDAGFAGDFITQVMRPLAVEIAARRIRVVVNAGGVNLHACRDALQALFAEQGLPLRVAVVEGDDLSPIADDLRAAGTTEMFTAAPMPERLLSINAYLGAFGIARALGMGADVVLTGRVVDSALVLGPLIHEFGWFEGDHDLLSAGSLAGHLLECGTQVTGGIITDWRDTVAGWDDMGFPIAICHPDGSFEITKPEGTGGLISTATVAEQLCYEVGDPAAYLLPDVTCDWSQVRLEQTGPDLVRVTGARGVAPTDSLKVSATWADGWRVAATMMVAGREAAARAQATAKAILARVARLLARDGFAPFTATLVELLGAESNYGTQARAQNTREVVLRLAASHPDRAALEILGREIFHAATAMAQGLTGFAGGRPAPQPVVRLFSCLVPKAQVPMRVSFEGRSHEVPHVEPGPQPPARPDAAAPAPDHDGPLRTVPLIALARARSGDKGDRANIGVLSRDPAFLPWIAAAVTPDAVRHWLAHFVQGEVRRHDWPGLDGFNLVLDRALGGGGTASLRHDAQGKALAQILLDLPVPVPAVWTAPGGRLEDFATEGRPHDR